LATGLIASGIVARLLPHPPNFAPIGAASLLAGARLKGWNAFVTPLLIMAVSDPLLGLILGYPPFTLVTPFVYASLLVNVMIGRRLQATERPGAIAAASLAASVQFFAVTNFGLWLSPQSIYPAGLEGLTACYVGALPWFGRTVAADLFFCGVLFGLHAWLSRLHFTAARVKP